MAGFNVVLFIHLVSGLLLISLVHVAAHASLCLNINECHSGGVRVLNPTNSKRTLVFSLNQQTGEANLLPLVSKAGTLTEASFLRYCSY